MTHLKLALTLKKRLMLFVCIAVICFFIVSIISFVISLKWGNSMPAVRILTILQDLILFIMPAIVTALLVTRQPASLLAIDRPVRWVPLMVAIATMLVSIPAMNYVIVLNQKLPLPDELAATLTQLEEQAQTVVTLLMGPHTVPNLIMSILIIGILAGFSEELLFRGGLQRLLTTGGINPHTAIWTTAIIFSIIHFQFYGFVPRMLLGAFFGYALYWTRTLWIPIILHITNNTLYLISQWFTGSETEPSLLDTIGDGSEFISITISIVLTAIGLWALKNFGKQDSSEWAESATR